MRILFTNNTLNLRAGTELYLYDVARELLARGHQPLAFTQQPGTVAGSLRDAGIPVVDDPRKVGAPPDIIHGQHHIETLIAVTSFPGVPAINYCHGWAPWQEAPLRFPRVLRYVAVDQPCWERLVLDNDIPSSQVELLLNFVDTARFQCRPALPAKPRRALAFGNYFASGAGPEPLRRACADLGITLDVVGFWSGYSHQAPEQLLPAYDLVFAKARSALEAMATGAAVVLCGPHGLGPMVTGQNWEELRRLNFGFRTLALPFTPEQVANEIRRYDPEAAARVRDRVRNEARLTDAVDRLCVLYEEVIRESKTTPVDPAAENEAIAEYMLHWAPQYRTWEFASERHELMLQRDNAERAVAETRSELDRRLAELERIAQDLNKSRSELAAAQGTCQHLENEIAGLRASHQRESESRERELAGQLESLAMERDHWHESYRSVTKSATWRITQGILQSRLVRAAGTPFVERLGALLRRSAKN